MQRSTKVIILITLLMLPATTHHDVCLCMCVTVEQADDHALGQPGSLGGIHRIGNDLVESAYRSVDVLAQRERVAQASDVAHVSCPSRG